MGRCGQNTFYTHALNCEIIKELLLQPQNAALKENMLGQPHE